VKNHPILLPLTTATISTLVLLSSAFGQGSLTPPGAPAPLMKTLDQIEARTPISSVPFTITNSGSYYLTGVLSGTGTNHGITVAANSVTIDLNGFGLRNGGPFIAILVSGARTNIVVRNGSISGWGEAIDGNLNAHNMLVEHVIASGNSSYGILAGYTSIVRDCICQSNTFAGISVNSGLVCNCAVTDNGGTGITASSGVVRDCQVQSSGSIGISVQSCTVSGCFVQGSGESGIYVDSTGSQIVGNDCVGNNTGNVANHAGIFVNNSNNRIEANHVINSGVGGIVVANGTVNNVIIRNSVAGTANNFSVPAGNDVGPIGTATNSVSPWANISHLNIF
jgi:hypothetical protein